MNVAPAANDDPYRWGAHGWTVTIDKGRADGVDVGTVLAIYQAVPPIPDPR